MEHDFLGHFRGTFPGAGKHLKKVVMFFLDEIFQWKFVFHFFQAIFDAGFTPLRPFFGK